MSRGRIFDIQRFCLHDGPGIRTTVFLQGCPLRCRWCHNPEGMASRPVLSFQAERCIGCGACVPVCAPGAHRIEGGRHAFDRRLCDGCGRCASACCSGALELIGREVGVEEVLEVVVRDEPFHRHSGGGMTVSGGEPMAQFAFTRDLLRQAKRAGLHCAMETCGYAAFDRYAELLPDVDLFLYDVKDTDPERHLAGTGVPLETIRENLKRLDAAGCRIWLRCPIVPGINADDSHLGGIAALAGALTHVERITLLPYHPLGQSKYARLGLANPLPGQAAPADHDVERWRARVASQVAITVDAAS